MVFQRQLFTECWQQVQDELKHTVELSKPVSDNTGNFEQEIAVLFFDQASNTPQKIIPVVQKTVQLFQKSLYDQYQTFRTLYELEEEIVSAVQAQIGAELLVSRYAPNTDQNLFELKFSLREWTTDFGPDGLVVMLYQHAKTPGLALRTLCKTATENSDHKMLKQRINGHPACRIAKIKDWGAWSTFWKEQDYPESSYDWNYDPQIWATRLVDEIRKVGAIFCAKDG